MTEIYFNAYKWYWLAGDGRLYSSATQTIITESDTNYQAWVAAGGKASPWPLDDAGQQTDAALQAVLDPYQTLFANNEYYARNVRWLAEIGGMTLSGNNMPLATDDRSKILINRISQHATADPTFTTQWIGADQQIYNMTNADLASMAMEMALHIEAQFSQYIATITALRSRQITTREEIDAAFADAKKKK